MTLTFKLDLQSEGYEKPHISVRRTSKPNIYVNDHFVQKLCPDTQTHQTDCSIWTNQSINHENLLRRPLFMPQWQHVNQ